MTAVTKGDREYGISLVESMLVVMIVAWLIARSIASFQAYQMRQERSLCLSALQDALAYARSEAFFRNTTISLCGSHSQERCHLQQDWSSGFIIFENLSRDNAPKPHQILRVVPGIRFGKLTFNGNPILHMSPSGLTMSIGTFLYTPNASFDITGESRALVVNRVFRVRSSRLEKP